MRTPPPRLLDVEALWRIERVGSVALAPDGRHAVAAVTRYAMAENRAASSLWLLATDGGAARRLTRCGTKDGQPAWSPRGDAIAFIARREQEGSRDESPQLYLVARDGGEARRISGHACGVESFKWLPDGRRIVFAAWVWPELRGDRAQGRRHKQEAQRKDSGYATGQSYYRHWDHHVPQGRVLHLLLLDVASSRVRDLFEGTPFELPRDAAGDEVYDANADGRRVAFVHDPAAEPVAGNRLALAEIDLRTRRVQALADEAAWDFGAPRYSPDGALLAVTAAHVGRSHTALNQLAVVRQRKSWDLVAPEWDRSVDAPLRWTPDATAVLYAAEDRGRRHVWRQPLAGGMPRVVHAGGWVQRFDAAADTLLVAADSAQHPVRVLARRGEGPPRRLESFNDTLLRRHTLGAVRELTLRGALGDEVQLWLTFPPGFDTRRRHPVMHVIHGGPHAAAGDTFGYRWNTHVLAAPGRVVAQLNYHGSSGFGSAFRDSLIGRQGALELQDIEAATDWLLAQRWADGRLFTASGGSYGGFLVAWMNGHVAPGRYRAYVCHAGVFDRVASFSADSYAMRPKDLAARYWEDMPRVLAQSPHAFVARMATPTLVIHGARDFRVPDCNGLAYYNTLKARGVAARLLWFADENHWVLEPRNSRQWYAEFLAWIAAHEALPVKPAKAQSAPA